MVEFTAGETWTTRGVVDGPPPHLVIGAIIRGDDVGRSVAACAVWHAHARTPAGEWRTTTVPFLPLTLAALAGTVVDRAAPLAMPDEFMAEFEAWQADPKGLSVFTIPFEGSLDGLIARQMAAIIGVTP